MRKSCAPVISLAHFYTLCLQFHQTNARLFVLDLYVVCIGDRYSGVVDASSGNAIPSRAAASRRAHASASNAHADADDDDSVTVDGPEYGGAAFLSANAAAFRANVAASNVGRFGTCCYATPATLCNKLVAHRHHSPSAICISLPVRSYYSRSAN